MNQISEDFFIGSGIITFFQCDINGKLLTIAGEIHGTEEKSELTILDYLKLSKEEKNVMLEFDEEYISRENLTTQNMDNIYNYIEKKENIFNFDIRNKIYPLVRFTDLFDTIFSKLYVLESVCNFDFDEKYQLNKNLYGNEMYDFLVNIRNDLKSDKNYFIQMKNKYFKDYLEGNAYNVVKNLQKKYNVDLYVELLLEKNEEINFQINMSKFFENILDKIITKLYIYLQKITNIYAIEYILSSNFKNKTLLVCGNNHSWNFYKYLKKYIICIKNADENMIINLKDCYY
jgi:hypothetical protein